MTAALLRKEMPCWEGKRTNEIEVEACGRERLPRRCLTAMMTERQRGAAERKRRRGGEGGGGGGGSMEGRNGLHQFLHKGMRGNSAARGEADLTRSPSTFLPNRAAQRARKQRPNHPPSLVSVHRCEWGTGERKQKPHEKKRARSILHMCSSYRLRCRTLTTEACVLR